MAAQGKKSLKDVTDWVEQGFAGYDDLNRMFQKLYRLDSAAADASGWQSAAAEFKKSYADYLHVMGLVPREEHLELVQKYERLKKRSAEQAETIRHLEMLLKHKGETEGDLTRDFARLMTDQADQFQKVMKTWTRLMKSGD